MDNNTQIKASKPMNEDKVLLTQDEKDSIVSAMLKAYRLKVWCPTIGRFVKYNKGEYYNKIGSKLTRTVLLNEYSHLFELGSVDNRIMKIF